MPIVQTANLLALGLVPYQINPHYLDPDPSSTHKGETREERLLQYLEESPVPVVGLREPAYLRVENGVTTLQGEKGARVFRRGAAPFEIETGAAVEPLLL
jgi:dipeptidase E